MFKKKIKSIKHITLIENIHIIFKTSIMPVGDDSDSDDDDNDDDSWDLLRSG